MNGFSAGPPSAMRTSGRLESTSIAPYRGPSGREQVAVTPGAGQRGQQGTGRPPGIASAVCRA